jgi:hypothetical protein
MQKKEQQSAVPVLTVKIVILDCKESNEQLQVTSEA